MLFNALSRGVTCTLLRPNPVRSARKCIVVAAFHSSVPSSSSLGEQIQRLRFRYLHEPKHHMENDEWAKIITVEGNIKSGKGKFAKELAERKDLRFFPSADYTYLITAKERRMDPEEVEFLMHEDHIFKASRDISLDRIYTNPEDWAHMARYQLEVMKAKFFQYADATAHLIRTGQGVVIENSFFSLPIFEHAFLKMKWQTKKVVDHLHVYQKHMARNFLPPQVIIYLDVPPEQCLEDIKKYGTAAEQHIPIEYLKAMEEGYSNCLREADRAGSKVIEFDWSTDRSMDEAVITMEDLPTLYHEYHRWDQTNGFFKKMMRDFSDDFTIHKMSFLYPPFDELNAPSWTYYANPMYYKSRPFWAPGYDPKKVKWLWLREP